MSGIHVKVCGITRFEDAERAADLGASALGFVFWPGSPRFVDPYRAQAIVRALPPFVTPVGVFVDQPPEFVERVASLVRLGAVQLHGREPAEYCARIRTPVIKAVGERDLDDVARFPAPIVILLDVARSRASRRHRAHGRLGDGARDRGDAPHDSVRGA